MNYNKTIYGGTLTRDPELKHTTGGTAVTTISIACNRKYKASDGEKREEVTFLEAQAWGKTAEVISKYFTKGSQILVDGYLKQSSWEDKDTGAKRSKIQLVIERFEFAGSTKQVDGNSNSANHQQSHQDDIDDDDIPF